MPEAALLRKKRSVRTYHVEANDSSRYRRGAGASHQHATNASLQKATQHQEGRTEKQQGGDAANTAEGIAHPNRTSGLVGFGREIT